MTDINTQEQPAPAALAPATGSDRRWCRWILDSGKQCKGKPLPMTSEAGKKTLCPVHAYLEGDFDEATTDPDQRLRP